VSCARINGSKDPKRSKHPFGLFGYPSPPPALYVIKQQAGMVFFIDSGLNPKRHGYSNEYYIFDHCTNQIPAL
jgi:hypothetical protein